MDAVKVALVADIHANRYALQAFIAYLSRNTDIEQVWNLGDFLQIGPHPAEVTEQILQDARFVTILGNNEQALLQRDPANFQEDEVAHQDWTIAQLGEERLASLRRLPRSLRLTVCGTRVLLTHEKPPAGEDTRDIDLICFGHTHLPAYETHGTAGMVNPGSLGFAQGHTSACFGILAFSESSFSMQYHAIPFARSMLKHDYRQRQVPDRERIFSIFLPGE